MPIVGLSSDFLMKEKIFFYFFNVLNIIPFGLYKKIKKYVNKKSYFIVII